MIPSTLVSKTDGNTGVVRPSADGVGAIIAPSSSGTANQPGGYGDANVATTDFGFGGLTDDAAYVMNVSQHPAVLVSGTASTAGTYGSITTTGGGTSVITAGAAVPIDDFQAVTVTFLTAGTIGVAGILYKYTLDGFPNSVSGVIPLGTANSITIPNTGIQLALAAGTILAGETVKFSTVGPQMTNSDLSTALEALRLSELSWELLYIHGIATATTVSTLDAWLAGLETAGKFRGAICNARFRSAGESEATYATAMQTAFGSASSTRVVVCADAGDLASIQPGRGGVTFQRAAALGVFARALAKDISVEPAYVADNALAGFAIYDGRGQQKYHDEQKFPGLDDLRLTALRTIPGQQGAFVNNTNLLSPSGSDYVYLPHLRVMNKGCEIAWQILTKQLSLGVQTRPDPNNRTIAHIVEEDAAHLEDLVNGALRPALKGRVSDFKFGISRMDDLSSNGPATLTSSLAISALRYVKTFKVNAGFVKTISQ